MSLQFYIQAVPQENQSVFTTDLEVFYQHLKEHQLHCDIKENDNIFILPHAVG